METIPGKRGGTEKDEQGEKELRTKPKPKRPNRTETPRYRKFFGKGIDLEKNRLIDIFVESKHRCQIKT